MGKFVVKYRKFILLLAVILIIPALIGMFSTKVNYDMLNYLPNSMETVIGQEKLME
jgi:predicted RND superfamily exporter protein